MIPLLPFPSHNTLSRQTQPVVLDLFCGAGGMSLGFASAGYTIGLGVEKETVAARTHQLNFQERCHPADIRCISEPVQLMQTYHLPQVDVIIGGPPCQGFTRVGRGKMRSLHQGEGSFEDPRNQLYREFVRFVAALKPLYFVMENVPDLALYQDAEGAVLPRILDELAQLAPGYHIEWRILHADQYGVPQTRKRLFIIGNRLGLPISWPSPTTAASPVTLWEAISDLPIIPANFREDEISYQPRYPLTPYQHLMRLDMGDVVYNHQTRYHNPQDLGAFACMPEGGKYIDIPERYKRYRDDIFRDKYRKLRRDWPSWTIEAHISKDSYRHIYPSRPAEPEPPRTISVREAARLQSFPDRFRFVGTFTQHFRQIGNAVPPLLAQAVAEALLPDIRRGLAHEQPHALYSGHAVERHHEQG